MLFRVCEYLFKSWHLPKNRRMSYTSYIYNHLLIHKLADAVDVMCVFKHNSTRSVILTWYIYFLEVRPFIKPKQVAQYYKSFICFSLPMLHTSTSCLYHLGFKCSQFKHVFLYKEGRYQFQIYIVGPFF